MSSSATNTYPSSSDVSQLLQFIHFDIDISFLLMRNIPITLLDTPMILNGVLFSFFQVSKVEIQKEKHPPNAKLYIESQNEHSSNEHSSNEHGSSCEFSLSCVSKTVFHSLLGGMMIDYVTIWCSDECAMTKVKYGGKCDGCFSKSYWSMRRMDYKDMVGEIKKQIPPVIVHNPLKPQPYPTPDGTILIDHRDMRDTDNRCEGGHFLPLTLAILATIKRYGNRNKLGVSIKDELLYCVIGCFNYYDATVYPRRCESWPYSRVDVKKGLRLCTYELEYIDNNLNDDNEVIYSLLPKGSNFLAMFETQN
jgi:hypothetical protein